MPDLVAEGEYTFTSIVDHMKGILGTNSVQRVLKQAAAMLCCDILAQDIAKAPMTLRERLPNGADRLVMPDEHPIAAMLADAPNRRHVWFEFDQMMVYWFALGSNAYAYVQRDNLNRPLALVPLARGYVTDSVTPDGDLFYHVYATTEGERSLLGFMTGQVPERDVIHVRGRMLDGLHGISTTQAGQETIETGAAIEDYRNGLFSDEGQIRGVFRRDAEGALSDQAFDRLKRSAAEMMKMLAQGKPIILEDKIQFQPIAVNPSDAELSKQLEAQITAIGRLWRIPPHKLFNMQAVKYENIEVLERSYASETLIPVCIPFEQRYGRILLSPRERTRYFFQRDREALTVNDPKALAERIVKLVERGVIKRNEARLKVGFNPVEGGDTFMIPANMILVDENNTILIGKQDPAGQAPQDQPADPNAADAPKHLRVVASN